LSGELYGPGDWDGWGEGYDTPSDSADELYGPGDWD
jgi:hypothetical protein